jgi:menaquinone-dependent protoporphyrinogen oxidase
MSRFIVAYRSAHGQTKKIAEAVAAALTARGARAELVDIKKAGGKIDANDVDGVFLGGYIHAGKYPGGLLRFAARNRQMLSSIPVHFFTACLAARAPTEESRKMMKGYLESFRKATGLAPATAEFFAGALPYTRYNPVVRTIMRKISESAGGDCDTSRDFEYTDWQAVEKFALAGMKQP